MGGLKAKSFVLVLKKGVSRPRLPRNGWAESLSDLVRHAVQCKAALAFSEMGGLKGLIREHTLTHEAPQSPSQKWVG